MEKEWPVLEECAQFKYGMLHPYLQTFSFESEAHVEDSFYYSSDEREDDKMENTHQTVLRFLQQVRESRGYDVDCNPPNRMSSPFRPVNMEIEFEDELYRKEVMEATEFAIDTINDETKAQSGRSYKLKKLEKVVDTLNMMLLLTFTMSCERDGDEKTIQAMVYSPPISKGENFSLEDWRVKPGV